MNQWSISTSYGMIQWYISKRCRMIRWYIPTKCRIYLQDKLLGPIYQDLTHLSRHFLSFFSANINVFSGRLLTLLTQARYQVIFLPN